MIISKDWKVILLLLLHCCLMVLIQAATSDNGGGQVAHSTVQTLTASNFQSSLEDPANGLWLLKFYAPWCGHCKRLAPVLDEVAPKVQGMMAIGKIDCTKEKALCKEYKIKGYPTLKFSLDGDIMDYPGSRKAEHIYGFAKKMSSPPVTVVKTYQQAMEEIVIPNEQGLAFVGYHPDVTMEGGFDTQANELTRVFGQVARKNQHIADFGWISSAADDDDGEEEESSSLLLDLPKEFFSRDRPFVAKVEAGGGVPPRLWDMGSSSTEERTTTLSSSDLLEFVKQVNMPTVVALGPHNFNKIGRAGRPLVIGAVDEQQQQQQTKQIQEQLLAYALNGPPIREKYTFGWIDGRAWKNFLEQFDVTSLPTVFVLNVPTRMYYKLEDDDEITTSINNNVVAELLQAVEDGKVRGKKAASTSKGLKKILEHMADVFLKYMPYSVIVVVGFIFLIVLAVMPSPDDYRPPYGNNQRTTTPDENNNNNNTAAPLDASSQGQQQQQQQHLQEGKTKGSTTSDDEPKKEK